MKNFVNYVLELSAGDYEYIARHILKDGEGSFASGFEIGVYAWGKEAYIQIMVIGRVESVLECCGCEPEPREFLQLLVERVECADGIILHYDTAKFNSYTAQIDNFGKICVD